MSVIFKAWNALGGQDAFFEFFEFFPEKMQTYRDKVILLLSSLTSVLRSLLSCTVAFLKSSSIVLLRTVTRA